MTDDRIFRINVHGDLAAVLAETARMNGISIAHLIENTLRRSVGLAPFDGQVEVTEREVINEGNHGFHLLTVVTDGYGNFVAENSEGRALARVDVDQSPEACCTEQEAEELLAANAAEAARRGVRRMTELRAETLALLDAATGQA